MNSFIHGTYANLESMQVGNFFVYGLSSSDRSGRPRWECICNGCRYSQTFEHLKLCSALESGKPEETLFCQNSSCVLARKNNPSVESLADIRRQEREATIRAGEEAAESKAKAKKQAANRAALEAERKQYLRFARAQMAANVMPGNENFMTFERWLQAGDHWRESILKNIEGKY